ncbi:hypothetical protein [Micromonospora polyrhachis]|uniref:Uncharacterized protein n=1 Tax=Micromonospora polyrhachis TaxID=1282883 RepID=A0A7W7SVA8_9ACTN|nr:hypothetical protein [Micromonospora polyrhachis]MBB4961211.1 hypothetical protein [Micromonospora polyrhachis]
MDHPLPKIPHLSRSTVRRLALIEHSQGWQPDTLARLLHAWSQITREPDYPLCPPIPVCSCYGCDPVSARFDLALRLAELPHRDQLILLAALRRTDRWYASRTLPDPHSTSHHWFDRRLMEQNGWGRLNARLC